jgi:hypothetical protein
VLKLGLDGAVLGTFKMGGEGPEALLIAGGYVWVTNEGSHTVTKLTQGA